MAGPTELPDQAAFPAHLLPAPEPDRAAMGRHAQEHHPQQMLRDLRRIRGNNPRIPARRGAQKVGRVLRFGHRQFSYNFTQGFSAPGVNRVYHVDVSAHSEGIAELEPARLASRIFRAPAASLSVSQKSPNFE